MKKVHKLVLKLVGNEKQEFHLPTGSKIIHCGTQLNGERICLWYELPDKKEEDYEYDPYTFQIFGTGHAEIPNSARHIGTINQHDFMWHIYRLID